MYAIVSIAGQQFKVEKGKKLFVHKLPDEVGASVNFDKVLLISKQDKVSIGEPYLDNALVLAQVLSHLRGDKIQVFKKKRRKGYKVLKGHRQYFTELLIEDISETGQVKKPVKQKAAAKEEAPEPKASETRQPEQKSKTAGKAKVKKTTAADTAKEKKTAATTRSTDKKTSAVKAKAAPATSKKASKPVSKDVAETASAEKTVKAKTAKKTSAGKTKTTATKATAKKKVTAEKKPDTSK